ncbi:MULTISPECIES: hypothetical protein [unclassified Streptomyces]|uniref:hypothetical protein n=1 Tax=unclassified Streptomyces TaxID=2593676 RepID=UPI003425E572
MGLTGTAISGLAVFGKATAAAGTRMPVLPVVAAVVVLIGVAFAGWGLSPVRPAFAQTEANGSGCLPRGSGFVLTVDV